MKTMRFVMGTSSGPSGGPFPTASAGEDNSCNITNGIRYFIVVLRIGSCRERDHLAQRSGRKQGRNWLPGSQAFRYSH